MLKMLKKSDKFAIISVLLICLCILSSFISVTAARDPVAPSWLKEGAYVKYSTNESGSVSFFDVTDSRFEELNYFNSQHLDIIDYSSASLMWQCISVNATMARLRVTFGGIGEKLHHWEETNSPYLDGEYTVTSLNGRPFQRTDEVYVDLYTRAVYSVDSTFFGTTHLWLPSNPINGQKITIWETDSETISIPATTDDYDWQTDVTAIYVVPDFFWMSEFFEINGLFEYIWMEYELNTGLGVTGNFGWDPIMAAIGISRNVELGSVMGLRGWINDRTLVISDTNIIDNIKLRSDSYETAWFNTPLYLLLIAVVLIVVAWAIKHRGINHMRNKWKQKTSMRAFLVEMGLNFLLGMGLVLVIVYAIYLVIQSIDITKVMIEIIVAFSAFFSVFAAYLLTSNDNRLDGLKKKIEDRCQPNMEREQAIKKQLSDERSQVTARAREIIRYIKRGFASFSASLGSSIVLLCIQSRVEDPLARLISALQARSYNPITITYYKDFTDVVFASTFEHIMAIFQVVSGIVMVVSLFLGIYYIWETIKVIKQDQETACNALWENDL